MPNFLKPQKFSQFLSLSEKFSLVSKLIIFGIVGSFFLYSLLSQKQQSRKIVQDLKNSASMVEKSLVEDFERSSYQLKYIANHIRGNGANNYAIANLFLMISNNLDKESESAVSWSVLTWINANNKLAVDGLTGVIREPIDLSYREYLKTSRVRLNETFISEPIYGSVTGRHQIPMAMGVGDKNRHYIGTLLYCFDVNRISTKIQRIISSKDVDFALLYGDKVIAKSTHFDEHYFYKKLKKARKKGTISKQTILSPGSQFIYLQDIDQYPISIALSYDKQESYQQYFNIFTQQILGFLCLFFVIVLALMIFYYRIIRPINKLSNFATAISEKRFDYVIKSPKNKEFRDLYETLCLVKNLFEREEILLHKLEVTNQKISTENFNKSEFLAAISHDIRNPLSAIVSFAHLIQDNQEATPEEIKEWSGDIEHCASDVLQFINDLMDVNQIASGEFSIDVTHKIDIAEIIRRSIRVNKDFAMRRRIKINSQISSDATPINLDQRRMKQILVNLISNSIKYSKEDTEIQVSAKRIIDTRPILQIIVKDRGFGMTPEQIDIAMQKYGRVENENTGKIDSFGLGLPLVKQLVEAQNGKMEIESTAGVGTKIILTFQY